MTSAEIALNSQGGAQRTKTTLFVRGNRSNARRNRRSDFGQLTQASSSIGRAAVSKTAGWGFDSLLACQRMSVNTDLKTQGGADMADKTRLVAAAVLVLAGIVAYYVLDAQPVWLRWGCVVLGVALGATLFMLSRYGHVARQFFADARVELRKVVWPTRKEAGLTTVVVFGFVIIAGLFFWVVDLVLAWATRHITGSGS
jgi:preprotein translocase subunit SecE